MSYVIRDQADQLDTAGATFVLPLPFLGQLVAAGDVAAAVTSAVGIQPCSPCEARRRWLNQLLVFRPWGSQWQ